MPARNTTTTRTKPNHDQQQQVINLCDPTTTDTTSYSAEARVMRLQDVDQLATASSLVDDHQQLFNATLCEELVTGSDNVPEPEVGLSPGELFC